MLGYLFVSFSLSGDQISGNGNVQQNQYEQRNKKEDNDYENEVRFCPIIFHGSHTARVFSYRITLWQKAKRYYIY